MATNTRLYIRPRWGCLEQAHMSYSYKYSYNSYKSSTVNRDPAVFWISVIVLVIIMVTVSLISRCLKKKDEDTPINVGYSSGFIQPTYSPHMMPQPSPVYGQSAFPSPYSPSQPPMMPLSTPFNGQTTYPPPYSPSQPPMMSPYSPQPYQSV